MSYATAKEEYLSNEEVKRQVRKRDGHRCRDCGITQKEHIQQTGKALEVHRVLPGSAYDLDLCVTLCRDCHHRKPKTIAQAYWWGHERAGVHFIAFNLYDPNNLATFNILRDAAARRGRDVDELVDQLITDFCNTVPQDYAI